MSDAAFGRCLRSPARCATGTRVLTTTRRRRTGRNGIRRRMGTARAGSRRSIAVSRTDGSAVPDSPRVGPAAGVAEPSEEISPCRKPGRTCSQADITATSQQSPNRPCRTRGRRDVSALLGTDTKRWGPRGTGSRPGAQRRTSRARRLDRVGQSRSHRRAPGDGRTKRMSIRRRASGAGTAVRDVV